LTCRHIITFSPSLCSLYLGEVLCLVYGSHLLTLSGDCWMYFSSTHSGFLFRFLLVSFVTSLTILILFPHLWYCHMYECEYRRGLD
jgi:hypothetical protein